MTSLGCLQARGLVGRPSTARRERASSLRVQSFWKGLPAMPTLPKMPTLPGGGAAPKGGGAARGGKEGKGGSAFVSEVGSYSVQGTVRKRNEDRLAIEVRGRGGGALHCRARTSVQVSDHMCVGLGDMPPRVVFPCLPQIAEDASEPGDLTTYAAVFDGHGARRHRGGEGRAGRPVRGRRAAGGDGRGGR